MSQRVLMAGDLASRSGLSLRKILYWHEAEFVCADVRATKPHIYSPFAAIKVCAFGDLVCRNGLRPEWANDLAEVAALFASRHDKRYSPLSLAVLHDLSGCFDARQGGCFCTGVIRAPNKNGDCKTMWAFGPTDGFTGGREEIERLDALLDFTPLFVRQINLSDWLGVILKGLDISEGEVVAPTPENLTMRIVAAE